MPTLHKISIHVWPAALTTLVEEVALHHLLGGDDGNFGSVFEFESCLCGLDEGDGVARTTFALVTHRSSKVIAVYVSEIPDSEFPDSYDFRNINGYDFTGPVRDQGKCGSCYTVAFVQAAEARLKLKYGTKVPVISAQQVMQCNFLNEGCEGGWPHMNAYFMERGHMVSDECAPYKGMTKG
jgi:hypothetical protein